MEYIVTSLVKMTGRRWLIHVNYEPSFVLYTGELRRYGISEGGGISETAYDAISALLSKRATVRAMNLLKVKDYAKSELKEKLHNAYYPESAVDAAIRYAEGFGYLDDFRYARNYIAFRAETKSKRQIAAFLQKKGIDSYTIQKTCEEYYEDNSDAEYEVLMRYMKKKLQGYSQRPDYEEIQKVKTYFYRKGFSPELINKTLNVVVDELYDSRSEL